MKKLIYLIAIAFIITACEDRDHPNPDYITYYEINDTVTFLDNYNIFCNNYFTVAETNDGIMKAFLHFISYDSGLVGNTVSYDFLINNNQFMVLNEGDTISSNRYFSSKDTVYLDNFAGKGEKYIGCVMENSIDGGSIYHCYGWIKVSLSVDKKTLHIIGRAINETKENSILAGQTE